MKKLFKVLILLMVVGIFAFSNNSTITKVRTATIDLSKSVFAKDGVANKVYDKVVDKSIEVAGNNELEGLEKGIKKIAE